MDGKVKLPEKPYLSDSELKHVRAEYDRYNKACSADQHIQCTSYIRKQGFDNIINKCSGRSEIYLNDYGHELNYLFSKNIRQWGEIWIWSLLISVVSLFLSFLYNSTIGRVVRWVWMG
jgi:hypothetical protein